MVVIYKTYNEYIFTSSKHFINAEKQKTTWKPLNEPK